MNKSLIVFSSVLALSASTRFFVPDDGLLKKASSSAPRQSYCDNLGSLGSIGRISDGVTYHLPRTFDTVNSAKTTGIYQPKPLKEIYAPVNVALAEKASK